MTNRVDLVWVLLQATQVSVITMRQRYRPLISALFGTIEHAMCPQPGRNKRDREVTEVSGLDMVEHCSGCALPM